MGRSGSRRTATAASLVALTVVSASCGIDNTNSAGEAISAPAVTRGEEPIATTVATEQHVTHQHLIDRCLDYIKFAAFVGETEAQRMWADAGQTDEGVRMLCQHLVVADRAAVETMSANIDAAEAAIEASSSTTPATSPPVPPPAHLVEGCVGLTNWRLVTGDSVDEALAAAARESASRLTEACYTLAQVDPQAQPPAAESDCDPNYTGCVPIASDVDCRGGSGNGPAYTGPVQVIGRDIYDLDRDGDGWACE
jgi:hypothetical protein